MEKILKWSTENSDPSAVPQQPATQEKNKLDPEIIDLILGKSDAVQIREAVEAVSNPETSVDDKKIALDNLEMLVEQIDTAIGNYELIENMNLWPQILSFLSLPEASLRTQALWVCGTAVQNNPKAQKAFSENGGLTLILNILKDANEDMEVKSKAIYTLSGAIKHYPPGLAQFEKDEGYDVLLKLLETSNEIQLLRKTIFLFNTLLIQVPDTVLRTLLSELRHSSQSFADDEINELRKLLPKLRTKYGECALTPIEWDELEKRIQ
ncbi:9258_t:CDS:2 [Dentiscutata erythropus]|uniref:9258_t:CDS:1 n=1 Tax=Dentiscutata erythropus TaxID=1348616 RepID=A0A9N9IEF7_9GLOM|nr:9258_t:CDS:2 [Dentiscutata erythropus]